MTAPFVHGRSDSTSGAVIRAVAEHVGADPVDLPPLFDAVDPDALDAMFRPITNSDRPEICIQFVFDDCLVEVGSDCGVDVMDWAGGT